MHLSPSHLNLFYRGNYYINKWLHVCAKILVFTMRTFPRPKYPGPKISHLSTIHLVVDPQRTCPQDLERPLCVLVLQYKNHAGWFKCKTLASSLTQKCVLIQKGLHSLSRDIFKLFKWREFSNWGNNKKTSWSLFHIDLY